VAFLVPFVRYSDLLIEQRAIFINLPVFSAQLCPNFVPIRSEKTERRIYLAVKEFHPRV